MNQIPNIEEKNKIREGIEERVEDFITRFSVNIADVKTTKELAKYWIRKTLLDLQETHHHQLQKARQDEKERIANELDRYAHESHSATINIKHLMEKLVDQSELDQDEI